MQAPLTEIVRGISAVIDLAKGDEEAVKRIDDSPEAVWRSFTGPFMAFPLFLLLLLVGEMRGAGQYGVEGFLLRESALFFLGVFLWPTLMQFVCVLLDREEQWGRYVSLYNWSASIQLTILLLIRVLDSGGMLPGPLANLASIVALGLTIFIVYRIAQHGLEIDALQTIGVVLGDVAIGVALNSF